MGWVPHHHRALTQGRWQPHHRGQRVRWVPCHPDQPVSSGRVTVGSIVGSSCVTAGSRWVCDTATRGVQKGLQGSGSCTLEDRP